MALDYREIRFSRPSKQIRLLTLHPADDDAPIAGDLVVHDMEDCPAHIAISYIWGDEKPRLPVQLNGQMLMVGLNCWYAMWQMRYHQVHSAIWIDSICINQNNGDEKNAQVAMMDIIYRGATMVAACIGAGQSLKAVREYQSTEPEMSTVAKAALETLQQNPYFGRMWIKQEVILGKEVRLFCGTSWLAWDDFEDIMEASKHSTMKDVTGTTLHPKADRAAGRSHRMLIEGRNQQRINESQLQSDDQLTSNTSATPWTDLWRVLLRYGDSGCSDPHDKVYAILSLLPEKTRALLDLKVDYKSPVLALGLDIVRRGLTELSEPTSQLGNPTGTVTAEIWGVIDRLFPTWLRLNPKDEGVRRFTVDCSVEPVSQCIEDSYSKTGERLEEDPTYGYLQTERRLKAQGQATFSNSDGGSIHVDGEEKEGRLASYRLCEISDAMPVRDIAAYLAPRMSRFEYDELVEEHRVAQGIFSLAALPPDLHVKILFLHEYMMFVVPCSMTAGDFLLDCTWFFAHDTKSYLPIVRRFDSEASSLPSNSNLEKGSYLVGWGLRLDWDGMLRPEGTPDDVLNYEEAPISLERPTFCLHYEDAARLAILKQDAEAYLTYPCTNHRRPSFLSDTSVFEDDLTTSQRPGEASPTSRIADSTAKAMNGSKNLGKGVQFGQRSEVRRWQRSELP